MVIDLLILGGIVVATVLLVWALAMIDRFRKQRRVFEHQLRDSEARSHAVTESMSEAVITTAPDGMIVDANSTTLQMFGYEREDLIGRNVTALVPERHREFFGGMIESFASREENFREEDREARGIRTDGVELHVKVSFADIRVGGERLFVGIVRNVTERKRIANALRESESQMRQIANAMPAFIAYVDADERFRFHNKTYNEFFQLTTDQIDGHTVREVFGEEAYRHMGPKVREVLSGYPVTFERTLKNPAGQMRSLAVHYFPRYDGDEDEDERVVGYYSLVTDITELKRVDQMKSEFVSTVSHELRTPLTSIRGSLGLIAGGVAGPLPDAALGLVEIAKSNCERLIRLINDILDSEKIESGKMSFDMRVVELEALLAQVLVANQGFADQHKVRLALEAPGEPIRVNVDSDRLNQVVTNLLSNAVKFSPAEATVQVRVRRAGNRARVEVRDRGPGIPDDFRGRIFQKFSQADSSDSRLKGGTGLGLSIAKAIVERLDGIIGFTSAPGEGTMFFFELPEWHEPEPQRTRARGDTRHRILVCEDDHDIARLIGMMLEKAGFDVDIARDAAQARARLEDGGYSAMTVDIGLPGEDGLSLIRSLRDGEATRDFPVIVVSATADEGRVQLNNEWLTVSDWLSKPIDENRLVVGVRNAVTRRDPCPSP